MRKQGSSLEKEINARNNVRCTQARNATHGLHGQHQDVDRTLSGRVNQNDRGQGSMEKVRPCMVWPTLESKTAKEQNRTVHGHDVGLSRASAVARSPSWIFETENFNGLAL